MANPPPATLYRDPLATLSSTAAQVPLSEERAADGKSLLNPPREDDQLSEWYESYPEEFEQSNNAFECVIFQSALETSRRTSVLQSDLVLTRRKFSTASTSTMLPPHRPNMPESYTSGFVASSPSCGSTGFGIDLSGQFCSSSSYFPRRVTV